MSSRQIWRLLTLLPFILTHHMPDPLAYFITWTCYGTWLHGDDRGSVDIHHNTLGTPFREFDPGLVDSMDRELRFPAFTLSSTARDVVHRTIEDHCKIRCWELLALNVRTNHVHVVVQTFGVKPEVVMDQLKAWATRRLREAGLINQDAKIWTRHGSTRYLNDVADVEAAVRYVLEAQ